MPVWGCEWRSMSCMKAPEFITTERRGDEISCSTALVFATLGMAIRKTRFCPFAQAATQRSRLVHEPEEALSMLKLRAVGRLRMARRSTYLCANSPWRYRATQFGKGWMKE
ncbi:hypothetical protein F5B19DRAFT_497039 [Rostrohypoxylon terebratum]|nr:hypothetical protein F5B19DRAFT_497039 [Rostrohypoxylon terebratum]